jgi:hypothetical protein
LAASCLAALPGAGYREAAQTLKDMAERARRVRKFGRLRDLRDFAGKIEFASPPRPRRPNRDFETPG